MMFTRRLFREPSHNPLAWAGLLCGVFLLIVSTLQLGSAIGVLEGLLAIALVTGMTAEVLPRNYIRSVAILRLFTTGIAIFGLVSIATNLHAISVVSAGALGPAVITIVAMSLLLWGITWIVRWLYRRFGSRR